MEKAEQPSTSSTQTPTVLPGLIKLNPEASSSGSVVLLFCAPGKTEPKAPRKAIKIGRLRSN